MPGAFSPSTPDPNPQPKNSQIIKIREVGDCLLVWMNYPNCTNFEGNKLLVYFQVSEKAFVARHALHGCDPHFTKGDRLLARFRPTDGGLKAAIMLAECLQACGPQAFEHPPDDMWTEKES